MEQRSDSIRIVAGRDDRTVMPDRNLRYRPEAVRGRRYVVRPEPPNSPQR